MHEISYTHGEHLAGGDILSFPQELDLSGRFWAEPEVLAAWIDRINDITLATMSLGALSRENGHAELVGTLVDAFQLEDKPIRRDVLSAGIMYGNLVASDSSPAVETEAEETQSADSSVAQIIARSGIPGYWHNRNATDDTFVDVDRSSIFFGRVNPTFMLLRELEVELLQSDVLATTLAIAQDHILGQVSAAVDFKDESERDSVAVDAQVLFYAGALCGAVKYFLEHDGLPKHLPPIQLHRGMKDNDIVNAMFLEYGGDDDVSETIKYALENKYSLLDGRMGKKGRHKVVGVFPNGVQSGPNGISISVPGVTQYPWQTIEYKDIKHLILRSDNETADTVEYRVVDATNERLESSISSEEVVADERVERLAGIVCKGNICISSIDIAHPHAGDLDTFVSLKAGVKPGELKYANELQYWEVMGLPRQLRNLGLVCLAGAAGPWVFEAVDRFVFDSGNLASTIAASGTVGLIGLSTAAIKRKLSKIYPMERFDRIYHQLPDTADESAT